MVGKGEIKKYIAVITDRRSGLVGSPIVITETYFYLSKVKIWSVNRLRKLLFSIVKNNTNSMSGLYR